MFINFFDQEYAIRAYTKEIERNSEIKALVKMYKRFKISVEETINILIEEYGLSEEVSEYIDKYWQE